MTRHAAAIALLLTSATAQAQLSPTLQIAYLNGSTGIVTLRSAQGAVIIRDGSPALGTNLFAVQSNNGGTTYFAVTASGATVNGSSLQTWDGTGGPTTYTGTNSGSAQTAVSFTPSGTNGLYIIGAVVMVNTTDNDITIVLRSAAFKKSGTWSATNNTNTYLSQTNGASPLNWNWATDGTVIQGRFTDVAGKTSFARYSYAYVQY